MSSLFELGFGRGFIFLWAVQCRCFFKKPLAIPYLTLFEVNKTKHGNQSGKRHHAV